MTLLCRGPLQYVSAEYLSYLLNNSSYVQNADSKSASRAGHSGKAKNIYLLCDLKSASRAGHAKNIYLLCDN